MPAVALTIAGSDPSGGAGIHADLKTFHQFGVYGEAVITLITVQNTRSVSRLEMLAADLVMQQIEAVIDDIRPMAAKTGALGSEEMVQAIAEIAPLFAFPLVVDPVMISKHGARLLSSSAEAVLKRKLLPRALLVTPNIPEAEALTGMSIATEDEMVAGARSILDFGCKAVLLKGGHRRDEPVDVFVSSGCVEFFPGKRIDTRHTHGTGCAYSAAITAGLAKGEPLLDAIRTAKAFIQRAIESAPGLGGGQGPINYFST